MEIKNGSKVKIDYTGTLKDGTVFDSSKGREPLAVELGKGQLIKGFEQALIGMKKGEEKDFDLAPEEAYGGPNPALVHHVPRDQLPPSPEPQKGMTLVLQMADGRQFPALITDVNGSDVTIDLNHPLAGKTLHFHITIVDIS